MYFEDDFLEDPENAELFDRIGLIVGLHPDQATERIVRFGLNYQKNFAVLPCCVFPKMYVVSHTTFAVRFILIIL
jgi:hypothetical protein